MELSGILFPMIEGDSISDIYIFLPCQSLNDRRWLPENAESKIYPFLKEQKSF